MTEDLDPRIGMKTAVDIAADVSSGRCSAVEVTREALARTQRSDLNAIVSVDVDAALAEAVAVDARIADGETLSLAGVPIVVKDNIFVAGRRVTQGSALFADFVAPRDAVAVARLRRAGAVIVGMGNTSQFACKGMTMNPLFGPTRHPRDPSLTPGGSSGGPAVAVAAGIVPLAIGTDAGGSSRRPPAHVGVVGFKPSLGAIPYGPGFDEPTVGISVIAPIARTVADVALAFEVMRGFDAYDADSVEPATVDATRSLRVAFSPTLGLDVAIDAVVADGVATAVARLRAAGIEIFARDPIWPREATEDALMPLQHGGLAALYGEAFTRDPSIFDPDIGRQIENGLCLSGVDLARALAASASIARAHAAFFADVDVLLCPTVPCVAWPLTRSGPATIGGRAVSPRAHAVFTPFVNHAKAPALSLPCGMDDAGLPFAMQIIGRRGGDHDVLRFAGRAEAILSS